MSSLDRTAVAALRELRVTADDKALPPSCWGLTVREVVDLRLRLSQLPTPVLTLSERTMAANIDGLAGWVRERGLELAPHGKTTMAPELWARQLDAGAWGITVANLAQLAVARSFGVERVMVANMLLSRLGLRWLAGETARADGFDVLVWADSVEAVQIMQDALADLDSAPPLGVLVELGGPGGRTGARDLTGAVQVAQAVASSDALRLAGVAGYEGALAHDSSTASLATVTAYLERLVALHRALVSEQLYEKTTVPVVTAGGSAFFDLVAEVLGPLTGEGIEVVLRSGAYLTHDDGFYRAISPLGDAPRTEGPHLESAMHGWVRVTSQPEPGLAIFDAGKRDLPFDEGLPEVQLLRPRGGKGDATSVAAGVTALNDQHGFLSFDPAAPVPVVVGDELRLGLSHPCTAFDKWGLVPVIDDADEVDPLVIDLVRTYF